MNRLKLASRILFFLFLFLSVNILNAAATDRNIQIDNTRKSLLAPDGCSYSWYFNGQHVSKNGTNQELAVSQPGNYTVEVKDENGNLSTATVTVAITQAGAVIKIYIIGDSTVCNYNASAYPMCGWGQVLPFFFTNAVQVDNRAIGGRSSRSFYEQGRWIPIKDALVPGDYVFIQFGHNDRDNSKAERYTSVPDYKKFLTTYCIDTKAKGATPVLVSPMVMNAWSGTTMRNVFTETGNNYRGAMQEVATEQNVPFVDLNMKSWNLYKSLGQAYITRFVYHTYLAGEYPNYPNGITDGTHFQEMGAIENARMVVQGIKELSTRKDILSLVQIIKPQYNISVSVNPTGSDQATTRSASYPSGLTVTLKTLAAAGKTFQKWTNAAGTSISTSKLTTVKSGEAEVAYIANYSGAKLCNASVTPAGNSSICKGESVTLSAVQAGTYVWKNNTATVGNTSKLVVTAAGSYTVEITDGTGCKATSSPVIVTVKDQSFWYRDSDNDGKGDSHDSILSCTVPSGYVADKSDLCPVDPLKSAPGNCGCNKTEQSCTDCFGTINGKAVTDACGRCVEGTTGRSACSEAEQIELIACSYDGVLESLNTGFHGEAYINAANSVGSGIHFTIESENAGDKMLGIKYANGSANARNAKLLVNGIEGATTLFPSTVNYNTWNVAEFPVTLKQGKNEIALLALTAEGLANIDELYLIGSGMYISPCIVTGNPDAKDLNNSQQIFPNPFSRSFTVYTKGQFKYELKDASGKVLKSGFMGETTEINPEVPSGIYFLSISTSDEVKVYRIIKTTDEEFNY